MAKQVTKSVVQEQNSQQLALPAPTDNTQAVVNEQVLAAQTPKTEPQKTLFVKVTTLGERSALVGSRIVDMYHFGTRNWLHNHFWWALHNGYLVETEVATQAEIDEYLLAAKLKLAEKFN